MARQEEKALTVADVKTAAQSRTGSFRGVYLVRKISERTTRKNDPFLVVEFGDRTGSFSANLFADSAAFPAIQKLAEGSVVQITGAIDHYQGRFSPKIADVQEVIAEEVDPELLGNLVEVSPEDPEDLWRRFHEQADKIAYEPLRNTVVGIAEELGDAYKFAPGAMKMHHAYRSGLLEHTVHMAEAAEALFPLYREVDPDLARAGILLHDVGKVLEYTQGLTIGKTRTGILQGHVVLGYRILREAGLRHGVAGDILERVEHIILSHQGELEWGAAAMAATPEAVFVSMVDNLDAKMGIIQHALRTLPEGAEFSDFMGGLQAQVLGTLPHYNSTPTPTATRVVPENEPQPDLFT